LETGYLHYIRAPRFQGTILAQIFLLFHGISDTTAPIAISDMFASTHATIAYHRVPDAEHTQCWNANSQMYEAELHSFLMRILAIMAV
jgi:hypothetical protein